MIAVLTGPGPVTWLALAAACALGALPSRSRVRYAELAAGGRLHSHVLREPVGRRRSLPGTERPVSAAVLAMAAVAAIAVAAGPAAAVAAAAIGTVAALYVRDAVQARGAARAMLRMRTAVGQLAVIAKLSLPSLPCTYIHKFGLVPSKL